MSYETLALNIDDNGVAVLTLNRPEKRNAMSPLLHREMVRMLEELRYDDRVKVVVITGAGKAFCAGMDLKQFFWELQNKPGEYDRARREAVEWRGRTLRYFPKPTIAMINGYCFGGAFAIVEGCDLAFAAEDAVFGLSEINFRMFPGGAVSKALANLLRPRDALFYGLTGRTFDGRVAAKIGFINEAVPADLLMAHTMTIATELAAKDPEALKATKDGYRHSLDMTWEAAMDYSTAKEFEVSFKQGDAWKQEGVGDFLDKKYRPGLESHGRAKG